MPTRTSHLPSPRLPPQSTSIQQLLAHLGTQTWSSSGRLASWGECEPPEACAALTVPLELTPVLSRIMPGIACLSSRYLQKEDVSVTGLK